MTKILNLTNTISVIHNNFSYNGKHVEVINIRRKEIENIWDARNLWGHTDTEQLMDNLPALSELAHKCCDSSYLGVLAGVFEGGFERIYKYHETFSYKCAEIIGSSCKRERIKAFVGIRQMDKIYILHKVPLSVKLLIL